MSADEGRPANPPGREELAFRVGSAASFTRQMLDALAVQLRRDLVAAPEIPNDRLASQAGAGASATRPRSIRANLGGPDDWLAAVVKSWATVADVLTFYQERILQEGFLRTAVETHSVYELVQTIGYRPRPGVAGTAEVAVIVSEVRGLPQDIELPRGLVIRTVPPPGAEPQTFETLQPLRARATWSVLRPPPATETQEPTLYGDSTDVDLQGTSTGLATGSPVLFTWETNGNPARILRLLTAVTIQPGQSGVPAYTRIAWHEGLDPHDPQAKLEEMEVLALRQQAGLFGQNAPRWQEMSPEAKQQVEPLPGGVLVASTAGWQPMNAGLPVTAPIRCLAVDLDGNLFAGTATEGVFRSTDAGASWTVVRKGLTQLDVQTIAVAPDGSLFAGSSAGGLHRSTDHGEIWEPANGSVLVTSGRRLWPRRAQPVGGALPATTVRSLAAARWGDRTVLFAGTDGGVFLSRDAGRSWLPVNRGLPGTDEETGLTDLVVHAVAVGPAEEMVYAGTARGVFRSSDGGDRWTAANLGIPGSDPFSEVSTTEVGALVSYRDRRLRAHHLVAGTTRGIYTSGDGGASWQASQRGPVDGRGPAEVLALAVLDDAVTLTTRVYAGTAGGLWSSPDHGASWTQVDVGGAAPVSALAVGANGAPLAAATPFGEFGPEWPGFYIQGNVVDLDTVMPGLVAGSWLVLRPGGGAGLDASGIYQVRRSYAVQRRDFGLAATVTRIEVANPDSRLAGFDLRQTRAYLQSEVLPLRALVQTAVPASLGLLRAALLSFGDLSRRVIVTGKTFARELLREPTQGTDVSQVLARDPAKLALHLNDELIVQIWRDGENDDRPIVTTTLLGRDLLPQDTSLLQGRPASGAAALAVALVARTDEREELVVTVSLASQTVGASLSAGRLAEALRAEPVKVPRWQDDDPIQYQIAIPASEMGGEVLELDLATLQVYGNVVPAAEGLTIANEILGDGNASQANQYFQLAQPLGYLPGEPPVSTLSVAVQGQLWTERPVLHNQPGDSRAYRVQLDERGRATLIFGSGNAGARLPTGRGNVQATYRTGMTTRQAPAGGLSLLATRPLGLDSVLNPLPTQPGAPAEDPEEIRTRAPLQVRTLGRVVSLLDYADFAGDYPGIAKAGAWGLIVAGSMAVQVTVAGPDGAAVDAALLAQLWKDLDAKRAHPAPLYIQSYRPVVVEVGAKVRIAAGRDPEAVENDLRTALGAEFGFAESRFGSSITQAAVVSAIQRVPGVVAVDAVRFASTPAVPGEDPRERRARPPEWDAAAQTLLPAELLRLLVKLSQETGA